MIRVFIEKEKLQLVSVADEGGAVNLAIIEMPAMLLLMQLASPSLATNFESESR